MATLPLLLIAVLASADPHADVVIDFQPGLGGAPGYVDPEAALGPPTRHTVDDEVVSPFVPAWGTDELVSLGAGGSITLAFDQPVENHPDNPYGIDLLLFGNAGCIDTDYPNGVIGGFFGADGGLVEVSLDGTDWIQVEDMTADAPWPTMAYVDAPPYSFEPGTLPTSYVRPIDPGIQWLDSTGFDYDSLVAIYDRSGGGVGIDLEPLGLESIRFVRISVPPDAFFSPELDALADVAPQHAGDATLDGTVDIADLLFVLAGWGQTDGHAADLDGSDQVDIGDLLLVLADWGAAPW